MTTKHRYQSLLLVATTVLFATTTLAVQGCGDGNQRYDGTTEVSYLANTSEFNVTEVEVNQIVVEDSVACRYGKDTLKDVTTISFLDGSFTMSELAKFNKVKLLSISGLKKFVFDALSGFSARSGYTPSSTSVSTTATSNIFTGTTNSSIGSINSSSNLSGSTQRSSLSNLGVNGYTSVTTSVQPTYYNSGVSTQNTSYTQQPTSNVSYVGQTTSYTQPQTVIIPVSWNATKIGYYSIVSFEASYGDEEESRLYLGSSTGFRGGDDVALPAYLLSEKNLLIIVRSGTQVLNTMPIQTN